MTSKNFAGFYQIKQIKARQPSEKADDIAVTTTRETSRRCPTQAATMTLSEAAKQKKTLPGEAYLLEDGKSFSGLPKPVSIALRDDGFDLYSYSEGSEELREPIAYSETLIRCSLNQIPASEKPYVIQLEAGLRIIFICFTTSDERDGCFTKILASVGQFLVVNPRSRKLILGKRTSNPLSPVSPLSLSARPSTKHFQLSSLLNALDINTSGPCLPANRTGSLFSFRFSALLVSLCTNAKSRRTQGKLATTAKKTVTRSYTLPFSKHSSSVSCKQLSPTNSLLRENTGRSSSLETRAALGILNIDNGDMRQYLART